MRAWQLLLFSCAYPTGKVFGSSIGYLQHGRRMLERLRVSLLELP